MKSLLVQLDGTARCAVRLQLATELARRHGSRLTALFASTPPLMDFPFAYTAETVPVQALEDLHLARRERAMSTFRTYALGAEAAWTELGVESVVRGVAAQALYADLMLLGQHDPQAPARELPADFVPSVMQASGRPALVVPHSGRFEAVGGRVLVAWKPSAESARALSAALPLLRLAQQVTVVQWGQVPPANHGQALDIDIYLRLHGVTATFQRHTETPVGIGELLLSRAADLGADLLVMGCYGHSRAREFLLGGATRTVLDSMTIPVLMSH